MKKKIFEKGMRILFLITALASIIAVLLICVFMFQSGVPAIYKIGFKEFFTGTNWAPNDVPAAFGILPMILGSIYVTGIAILIGVPIGLFTAIYMAFYCPKKIYRVLKSASELLAGIPSIVYGFFGLVVIVPLIRNTLGGNGNSILTAGILLGIMILPSVIGISESALRAVPGSIYEGAVALGATKESAIMRTILPAAKSGVLAAVVLSVGRAIGETMAVVMVAGNQPRMPGGILSGVRTLTSNIVIEMGYAAGLHRDALIATGVVLFVFILIINICFSVLREKKHG